MVTSVVKKIVHIPIISAEPQDVDNTKYYEIKNYEKTYHGQLDYWFYNDQNKDYWIQLAKELKTKGFKAISEHYDTEVYDSMTTYTHYYIRVVL